MNPSLYITVIKAYQWIYVFAFCIAMYHRFKKTPISIKNLDHLLLFIIVYEVIVTHYFKIEYGDNRIVHNICNPIYVGILIGMYFTQLQNSVSKKLAIAGGIIWGGTLIYYFSTTDPWDHIHNIVYIVGLSVLAICIFLYFNEVLIYNQYNLKSNPYFYLGIGILIFYVSSFTLIMFINDIYINDNIYKNARNALGNILRFGNIILSLGYLGAILCSKKETSLIK